MLKTLLAFCGLMLVSVTGLQAQHAGRGGSPTLAGAHAGPSMARPAAFAGRPSSYRGGFNRSGGSSYGGYRHHYRGNYGRYYYLGGNPYFYPFGFGFGYPYYSGSYYGGFGNSYGYPDRDSAYNGRLADEGDGQGQPGGSLPSAVQRQLAKRGYYKGTIDGQFGPASREALSRFQKKSGLKQTGKIDEETLEALGFTDER